MPYNIETSKFSIYNSYIRTSFDAGKSRLDIAKEIIKKDPTVPYGAIQSYIQRFLKIASMDLPKPEPAVINSPANTVFDGIKGLLKKSQAFTIEQLADQFDVGPSRIKKTILELEEQGYNIKLNNDIVLTAPIIAKSQSTVLNVEAMSTGFHKFGAVGDNHMGSKYARMDVLNALYDLFEAEVITTVYNTGNWIDGEARFNRQDLNVHGLDNQVRHFVDDYPKRKGITTYYVAGDDHEGWYNQNSGLDIGKHTQRIALEQGRTDLVYLGYMEADIVIPAPNGKTTIRVLHPGGGSSYAISYTMQKIVESYQGGEKPDVLLAGHYHKADYLFCRGVHCVQTGCTQDQTPFMRKKKLAAHLGGWIIEMAMDTNGAITRFKQEYIPFYDNAYYQKWVHKS
jgi:hypothetical protein